jgi:hypothetical protein
MVQPTSVTSQMLTSRKISTDPSGFGSLNPEAVALPKLLHSLGRYPNDPRSSAPLPVGMVDGTARWSESLERSSAPSQRSTVDAIALIAAGSHSKHRVC